MRVGLLTGGGDCPGLNAVIRAVVRRSLQHGFEVLGIKKGWLGLVTPEVRPLTLDAVSGILHVGGTILATSRCNPFKLDHGAERVLEHFSALGLDAVIAVGGEGTMRKAHRFATLGMPLVGVPKTIDNDLPGTDATFGFDTAVAIATEAIDRLHSTAEAHNRVMVVEVMGRDVGWIATYAGLAGGADVILIPEVPWDIEEVCRLIKRRHWRGKTFSIVVVAEGVRFSEEDEPGGIAHRLAREIETRTQFETRVTVLGHIQRGGSPTAYDRILATRFGIYAADMVQRGEFGRMAALRGREVISVPLEEAATGLKKVDRDLYAIAQVFFG
ncbi:MAG: 6-phosphofructokinase [Deltaproteobacteria bacterium]|nr:6-phosphofructokinase [Deltaproteobacteria bacterium]MBI3079587.1 6-phosphofructokinase [Deltaproteobacteria bacterium]